MKKFMFLAAVVSALGLTSCSDIEKDEQVDSNKINFKTVVGTNNKYKAVEATNANLLRFNVFAYNTGKTAWDGTSALNNPYMNNVEVTRTAVGNSWAYQGNYFWPIEEKLQFFAYSGTNVAYNTPATGYPSFTYTVNDNVATQEDLLVTNKMNQSKSEVGLGANENSNGFINFAFKHALTQINFSFKGQLDLLKYTVTKVEVLDVNNQGTFTYNGLDVDKQACGAWSAQSGNVSYSYYSNPTGTSTTGISAVSLGSGSGDDKALMLLPQTLGTSSKIRVTYKVEQNQGNGEVVIFNDYKEVSLKDVQWQAGQKIRYTLSLPHGAAPLAFTTTFEDWDAEDDVPVTATPLEYTMQNSNILDSKGIVALINNINTVEAKNTIQASIYNISLNGSIGSNISLDLSAANIFNLDQDDQIIIDYSKMNKSSFTITANKVPSDITMTTSVNGIVLKKGITDPKVVNYALTLDAATDAANIKEIIEGFNYQERFNVFATDVYTIKFSGNVVSIYTLDIDAATLKDANFDNGDKVVLDFTAVTGGSSINVNQAGTTSNLFYSDIIVSAGTSVDLVCSKVPSFSYKLTGQKIEDIANIKRLISQINTLELTNIDATEYKITLDASTLTGDYIIDLSSAILSNFENNDKITFDLAATTSYSVTTIQPIIGVNLDVTKLIWTKNNNTISTVDHTLLTIAAMATNQYDASTQIKNIISTINTAAYGVSTTNNTYKIVVKGTLSADFKIDLSTAALFNLKVGDKIVFDFTSGFTFNAHSITFQNVAVGTFDKIIANTATSTITWTK